VIDWQAHLGLAYILADRQWRLHEAQGVHADYEDVAQEARIGLWQASLRFDPHKGAFSTCAYHRIRGAILHYYRDQVPLIHIPARRQEGIGKLFPIPQVECVGLIPL
jgi:RNA polymerase sigma factor (sigma-70 family)